MKHKYSKYMIGDEQDFDEGSVKKSLWSWVDKNGGPGSNNEKNKKTNFSKTLAPVSRSFCLISLFIQEINSNDV